MNCSTDLPQLPCEEISTLQAVIWVFKDNLTLWMAVINKKRIVNSCLCENCLVINFDRFNPKGKY